MELQINIQMNGKSFTYSLSVRTSDSSYDDFDLKKKKTGN